MYVRLLSLYYNIAMRCSTRRLKQADKASCHLFSLQINTFFVFLSFKMCNIWYYIFHLSHFWRFEKANNAHNPNIPMQKHTNTYRRKVSLIFCFVVRSLFSSASPFVVWQTLNSRCGKTERVMRALVSLIYWLLWLHITARGQTTLNCVNRTEESVRAYFVAD